MWNVKNKTHSSREQAGGYQRGGESVGKMGEEDQEVQTPSYKQNKLCWYKYSMITTFSDIMLQIWKLLLNLKTSYHKKIIQLCMVTERNYTYCGDHFTTHAVLCLVAQSCPSLCDPMNYSLPGSPVHGDSPGQNTGVGCHAFLQGIVPAQGLNPGLPHCRQILYHLSHQGSSRILEWVAYPFSSGSSQTRNWTRVSWIAGRFFTNWTTRETLHNVHKMPKLMSCCMSIIFQLKKKAELLSEVEEKKCQLSSSEPDRVPEMWLAQSMRSIRYPRLLELVCDHEFR